MFIGSKPKDLFPRQNKAAADFYRRQQQKKIHAKGPYLVQRSFRRNEGTTDYATIPEITLSGDFSGSVEFSTSLTSGIGTLISGPVKNNSSLVLDVGVSAVRLLAYNSLGQLLPIAEVNGSFNDGAIHTAYFSLSGITAGLSIDNGSQITADWTASDVLKVSNLYRRQDDSNKLPGILANLKIWDNGTLIRDYPLDDNSDDLRELASGQNGTVINGNASDWGLFQQQATGEWLGQELWIDSLVTTFGESTYSNSVASIISSAGSDSSVQVPLSLIVGNSYRFNFEVFDLIQGQIRVSDATGVDFIAGADGVYSEDLNSVDGTAARFGRQSGITDGKVGGISVKEVLNVA